VLYLKIQNLSILVGCSLLAQRFRKLAHFGGLLIAGTKFEEVAEADGDRNETGP